VWECRWTLGRQFLSSFNTCRATWLCKREHRPICTIDQRVNINASIPTSRRDPFTKTVEMCFIVKFLFTQSWRLYTGSRAGAAGTLQSPRYPVISSGLNARVSDFKARPYNPLFIVQTITGGYFAGNAGSGIYWRVIGDCVYLFESWVAAEKPQSHGGTGLFEWPAAGFSCISHDLAAARGQTTHRQRYNRFRECFQWDTNYWGRQGRLSSTRLSSTLSST